MKIGLKEISRDGVPFVMAEVGVNHDGDVAKARAAYADFFGLWKDADPDIPILVAARGEYAKLK